MKGRARGVLCVGRVYCDAILSGLPRLPSSGTEIFADGLQLRAGGGAFTTAAYLSALGRPAYLAAALPAAPFDQIVLSDIAAAGVDASACVPAPPGSEPQLTVALVGAGDRAFVTRRCGPASPAIAPMATPANAPRSIPLPALVVGAWVCGGGAVVSSGAVGSKPDCSLAQVRHSPSSFFCCSADWPLAG